MAFDGITTAAVTKELRDNLILGKIDKIYQPEPDELLLNIYTKSGNKKLYATTDSSAACVRLIDENLLNPPTPLAFCMLLRKHLQGARIVDIRQKDSERIIEIYMKTLDDMGFNVSKKLVFEIMGRHSNIILVNASKGTVIDSIKRVSIDVSSVRPILPGKTYEFPPAQDKIPFKNINEDELKAFLETPKTILAKVGGISPSVAREIHASENPYERLCQIRDSVEKKKFKAYVYTSTEGSPVEFAVTELKEYEEAGSGRIDFDSISAAMSYFFESKESSNRAKQKSHDLLRSVSAKLDKLYLKKQRLSEDLLKAENSEDLRLCGELLTANIHKIKSGMSEISVINYYDGSQKTIKLDPRFSPNKNAQIYFKRYGKAKTAISEKKIQLDENQLSIDYLESVLTCLNNASSIQDIEDLRSELEENGYIRLRKQRHQKSKHYKPMPLKYESSDGFTILVGRNNKENDYLTLTLAMKTDMWLHTKDIPGSHVIIRSEGKEISDTAILEAAALAAYHSKGRNSENVPVDYVPARYVKKTAGAKPGMVIFTNNMTTWINPKELPRIK